VPIEARLQILEKIIGLNIMPEHVTCLDCNTSYEITEGNGLCPFCGSFGHKQYFETQEGKHARQIQSKKDNN